MGTIDDKRSVSELPIKPRRTKGTYSYRARNYFATAAILVGSIFGIAWFYLPTTDKIRKSAHQNLYAITDEYRQRSMMQTPFGGGTHKAKDIEKLLEQVGAESIELKKDN